MVLSLLRQQIPRRTFTTSARRLGGGAVGKAQEKPTYRHKFLKEPAEVAVSCLELCCKGGADVLGSLLDVPLGAYHVKEDSSSG